MSESSGISSYNYFLTSVCSGSLLPYLNLFLTCSLHFWLISKKNVYSWWLTLCATFIFRWIIGAAVVNAFYSPNRNQIGRFTTILRSCMDLINHLLLHNGACQLSRGKPASAFEEILGKIDRLFFSKCCFVDEYSTPHHTRTLGRHSSYTAIGTALCLKAWDSNCYYVSASFSNQSAHSIFWAVSTHVSTFLINTRAAFQFVFCTDSTEIVLLRSIID